MGKDSSTREAGELRALDPRRLPDHVDVLYRAALALCGSHEDAEDLVQEAYARILAKPRTLRQQDELRYLVRTVRNVYFTQCKAHSRRPRTVADDEVLTATPDWRPSTHAIAATREVFRAIASLPLPHREVVIAVDVLGLSYPEAACELGVPVGTIMSRLYRARERVARLVAE